MLQITGQMETTMTRKFCQGGNLLALMADRRFPSWLAPVVAQVEKFVSGRAYGGTLLDEVKGPLGWSLGKPEAKQTLETSERQLLYSQGIHNAQICSKVVRNGLEVYQDIATSAANSGISYTSSRRDGISSGRITRIVSRRNSNRIADTYLLVQPFRPLSIYDAKRDPFRRYPEFQAELVYATPSSDCEVVPLRQVLGHIALCPFNGHLGRKSAEPCLITLSLSRVCPLHR